MFRGRPVVSAEARAYRLAVSAEALAALAAPLRGAVRLTADVYVETRRRDLDNCIKVLCDALQGVAFEDDNQIAEIHARRFVAPKPKRGKRAGFVIVTVEPLELTNESRTE